MGCTAARPTAQALLPAQPGLCALHTDGALLRDQLNRNVLLRGPNLPSLAEMEAAGTNPGNKLGELARAGARVVRLTLRERETSPSFAARKLVPFVIEANAQGIFVIIAFDFSMAAYDNARFDFVEDWLREQLPYFNGNPGVLFEPIRQIQQISPLRRKNVSQRLVDALRGYRAQNLFLATEPLYLLEADPAVRTPLTGGNLVYAVRALNEIPASFSQPVAVLNATGDGAVASIALTEDDTARFSAFWRTSTSCTP